MGMVELKKLSEISKQPKRANTRVRRTLGIVLVAMLGLAFQPCAMAMNMDGDHPCPHCPIETGQEQHHQNPKPSEVADCDYVEIYSHDSRTTQAKFADSLKDLPVFVDHLVIPSVSGWLPQKFGFSLPSATDTGSPPLNLLYCVYLI